MAGKETINQVMNDGAAGVQNVSDGQNMTPRISVDRPIANIQFRTLIDQFLKFVTVGGDLV